MLDKAEKIKLVLIATYPKMSKIFMRIAEDKNIIAYNIFASFDDAVKLAREMEHKVDAILSRGGTAVYIQNAVNIPVIFIPITPFDIIQVLHGLNDSVKDVAFIHSSVKVRNMRDIENMYDVRIHEYMFSNKEDIYAAVDNAKNKGLKVVIGGEVATKYAEKLGLQGIQIGAGEDTIYRSVREALRIIDTKKQEKYRAARLEAAFASIAEGIVVSDPEQRIVMCNTAAEYILGKEAGKIQVEDYRDEKYDRVFRGLEEEYNHIGYFNNQMIAITHRPIFAESIFAGVVSTFENVTKIQKMEKKIRKEIHSKGFVTKYKFDDIITCEKSMEDAKEKGMLYAKTDSSILIEGESGTGKELFAQSIHSASNRSGGPFIAINCAAIPEHLLESELFGYESGAFTGAKKEGKQGLFEMGHEGTLFLDEIGELPITLQTRLLRVLQEKEVMRIGGDKIIPVDIRIISATNKDLNQMIEEKKFREDLYYRLNVFNVKLPPLRQRRKDIRILLKHFLNIQKLNIEEEKVELLYEEIKNYDWPGNIRELQNVAERIVVLNQVLSFEKVSEDTENAHKAILRLLGIDERSHRKIGGFRINLEQGLKGAISEIEKEIVDRIMEEYDYDQEMAAQKLQIGKTTLWRKSKYLTEE